MFEHLKIWRNGEMVPWKDVTVPILSHGLSRGSALFEVFGIHPGPDGPLAFRMDRHLDRLFNSMNVLGMTPGATREQIQEGVIQAVKANNVQRGLIKLMAYWGEEAVIALVLESKLDIAICAIPEFEALSLDQARPIDVCFTKWRKIRADMLPSEAKACANYLSGMLARKDAMSRGYDLGILLTADGLVAEGSIESVFMVKDNVLQTPPLGNILSSITRMSILEAAQVYGIDVKETPIAPEQLQHADELFTCHSGIKVLPVKRIEDRNLDPVPGPITAKAMDMMNRICTLQDDRFKHWFQPVC